MSSIEVKSDDSPETQPLPSETMRVHLPANDNVSTPEPTLIPKEALEIVVAIQPQVVVTKAEAVDDKETISPSAIDYSELVRTIEASVDEMRTVELQTKATVEVGEEMKIR